LVPWLADVQAVSRFSRNSLVLVFGTDLRNKEVLCLNVLLADLLDDMEDAIGRVL
jgi:hypothetical protein